MKKLTFYFSLLIALALPISCSQNDEFDDANGGQLHSFQTEIAKSFVLGIAKGAGGKVGDEATGWVLKNIFGESSEPSISNEELADEIQEIGTKLDNLSKQIENFKKDVEHSLQVIYVQGIKNQYTTQVSGLEEIFANVQTIRNDFINLSTQVSTSSNDWGVLAKQIDTELDIHTLETQLATIQNSMTIGSLDGAIKLWGELTLENMKKSNADDCFLSVMNHFQHYYLVQADLLFFIIEKAHKVYENPDTKALPALAQYRKEMLKQAAIFLNQAESIITHFANYMENDFNFREDWHLAQYGKLKKLVTYQSDYLAFADELVGQAMGWENSITIRFVDQYSSYGPSIIEETSVTLVNKDTGEEYSSGEKDVSVSLAHYLDQSQSSYQWEIKRFIFNNLPNGTYQIKDTYDNLKSFYENRYILFLNDAYLSSPLTVSDGSHINIFCQTYAELENE
ncbi:hypothetical protein [Sunxiuqinia rutila]|uniref:hypothetical protein n=1 Tax=Sunxiuqinia rutila TaxID=1397841 RepID=UPI003D36F4FF